MIRFTLLYQLRHGMALSGMFMAPDWDLSIGQCWLISVSQSHRAQVLSRVTIGSKDVLWSLNWQWPIACYSNSACYSSPANEFSFSQKKFLPVRPTKAVQDSNRLTPRPWTMTLQSKPPYSWSSLKKWWPMTSWGLNLDSNWNSAAWPTSCKGLSLDSPPGVRIRPKPQNQLWGV